MKPNGRSASSKGWKGCLRGLPLGPRGAATNGGCVRGLPLGLLGVGTGVDRLRDLSLGLLGVATGVGGGSGGDGRDG